MKKEYDDDDGRTVADMSNVERPGIFDGWIPKKYPRNKSAATNDRARKDPVPMDKEERRAYVISALVTALAVWAAFGLGLGLLIFLLTKIF